MHKIRYLLVLLGLAWTIAARAQQVTIRGVVTDAQTGEPLIGVQVLVPARIGAATDVEGRYQLILAGIPDSLLIRYIGYENKWVTGLKKQIQPNTGVFELDIQLEEAQPPCCEWRAPIQIIGYIPQMDALTTNNARRGDNSSIEQGMNAIPGVKFESRGPGGSRRLAIRGGFLRSPFGVRDVKAYYQGSPLTSPDGSTALELIDPALIGQATIKKGPFASEFGAVSSGVAFFNTSSGEGIGKYGGMVQATAGSFGYQRLVVQATIRKPTNSQVVNFIRQKYAGYRAQEANDKYQFQYAGSRSFAKQSLQGSLMLYQGSWELPGALDSTQVAANPRQALPISETLDAHVDRRHLRASIGHYALIREWSLSSTAYFHLSDKENPYGTSAFFQGYKIENATGFGGRSQLGFPSIGKMAFRLGGEYQYESLHFQEFENLNGQKGNLLTRTLTHSTQAHAFAEGQVNFRNHHRLKAQLSLNKVRYAQKEAFSTVTSLATGTTRFSPALASSLEWAFHATDEFKHNFFFSAATGYSPPALWEVTDTLGHILSNLKPETGLNIELRSVSSLFDRHIKMEWNIYHYLLWNAIVPQTLNSGSTVYENKGSTQQMGVEGMLKYRFRFKRIIKDGSVALNGTAQFYRFQGYQLNGDDLSGNRLPGVPALTMNLLGDFGFAFGSSLQFSANWVGKNYLNNANTVQQSGYLLLNLKVGHSFFFKYPSQEPKIQLYPYIGINNLLNTQYTNFPQLNAAGGKYWNPSPGINYFGGVQFNF
jgi:iron complex outermembrane recepter protein